MSATQKFKLQMMVDQLKQIETIRMETLMELEELFESTKIVLMPNAWDIIQKRTLAEFFARVDAVLAGNLRA